MKIKLLVLFGIVLLCALVFNYDKWSIVPESPAPIPNKISNFKSVPDFSYQTLDAQSFFIRSLPETGILLHFWASWCAPCQIEFPVLLQRIADADGKLALVAVSIDDNQNAMEKFIARQKLGQPAHVYWVWDKDKSISLETFNTSAVPETILINKQRLMVDKIVGDPDWSRDDVRQQLQTLTK